MKLLFLTNLYPPNVVGGYERLCFEVASGLSARGHQVYVLTSDYGSVIEEYPAQIVERSLKIFASAGDIYEPFNCTPEQRLTINTHNVETLLKAVIEFQPNIIFVWNLYFFDLQLLEAVQQLNRPIAYLLTDNWLIYALDASFTQNYFVQHVLSKQLTAKKLYAHIRARFFNLIKPGFKLPGHAIFSSRFMHHLYEEANIHFDSQTVIYHGVNLSQHIDKEFISRQQPLQHGELKLLIAGRIVEIKGIHTAIEALPLILRELPGVKINLTVRGDDRDVLYIERLRTRIDELGLQNIVKFAKSVPEDELFHLFQSHDIYLFPSLYEPFSLTLIHALAAGIPTIASNVGGNSEIIQHLQTGLLFPSANIQALAQSVIKLSASGSLRQSISERARFTAQQYTFEKMLNEVEQLLEAIK